jgi:hypothetical protein
VLRAGGPPAAPAAALAGELGDRSLVLALREQLTNQLAVVAAARALWRLTREIHTAAVLNTLSQGFPRPQEAVSLLIEMRATSAVDALRELAERDARVVTFGLESETVMEDERLRTQIREAVVTLTTMASEGDARSVRHKDIGRS